MQSKITATAPVVRRWLAMAEQTLANHSDRLNAINIYPVADADTGTNLYLTVRAAAQEVADLEPSDVGVTLAAAGRAAMEQARGNSGTLFAVSLAAMAEPLIEAQRMSGPLLAASLHRAQLRAWSALSEPMPGTTYYGDLGIDLALAIAGPIMGAIALNMGYPWIFFSAAVLSVLGLMLTL